MTQDDLTQVEAYFKERYFLIPKAKELVTFGIEFVDTVARFVCEYKGIDLDAVKYPKNRTREFVDHRRLILYLVNKISRGGVTQQVMGNYFNKNHATVFFSVHSAKQLIESNKHFRMDVENVERALVQYLPPKYLI